MGEETASSSLVSRGYIPEAAKSMVEEYGEAFVPGRRRDARWTRAVELVMERSPMNYPAAVVIVARFGAEEILADPGSILTGSEPLPLVTRQVLRDGSMRFVGKK